MNWNDTLTNLNYLLAALYPTTAPSIRVVTSAGIPAMHIAFNDRAIDNWFDILSVANRHHKVADLIQVARRDYPEDPHLKQAERGQLNTVRGPQIGQELDWRSSQPAAMLEQLMDKQSTLLPISFLEVGLQIARSVALVRLAGGTTGTGFLTANNLFVTNHHVIHNEHEAKTVRILFNYQKSASGLDLPFTEFDLDPDQGFATSPTSQNDWTIVRVHGDANAAWGAIELTPGKIEETDRVNIVQHPGGGPKQIALYHNIIAYKDERRLQYLTDTLPGSSGSPVFNSNWQIVSKPN